jgi:hypothetical protein
VAVDLYAQIAGYVVAAGAAAIVVVRAATAPAPPPLKHATEQQMRSFAFTVASQEDEWRAKAAEGFPADNWSQRDDFHGREAQYVRDLAGGSHVPYEDVFRAIDEDIHGTLSKGVARGPMTHGDRSASAVPCHPRPIFD